MMDIQLDNRSIFAEKTMQIVLAILKDHLNNELEKIKGIQRSWEI